MGVPPWLRKPLYPKFIDVIDVIFCHDFMICWVWFYWVLSAQRGLPWWICFFWLLLFLLIAMCGAFNIKNMGINIGYTWLYFDVVFVPRSSYPSECKLWKWDRWFATWCNTWCRTQQGSMIQPTFIKVCVVYYNILPPHVRTRVGLHVKFPCFFSSVVGRYGFLCRP